MSCYSHKLFVKADRSGIIKIMYDSREMFELRLFNLWANYINTWQRKESHNLHLRQLPLRSLATTD